MSMPRDKFELSLVYMLGSLFLLGPPGVASRKEKDSLSRQVRQIATLPTTFSLELHKSYLAMRCSTNVRYGRDIYVKS